MLCAESDPAQMLHRGHLRQGPETADTKDSRSSHHVHPSAQILHRENAGRLWGAQDLKSSDFISDTSSI